MSGIGAIRPICKDCGGDGGADSYLCSRCRGDGLEPTDLNEVIDPNCNHAMYSTDDLTRIGCNLCHARIPFPIEDDFHPEITFEECPKCHAARPFWRARVKEFDRADGRQFYILRCEYCFYIAFTLMRGGQ